VGDLELVGAGVDLEGLGVAVERLFGSLGDLQSKGPGRCDISDPTVLPTSMIKAMTWADRESAQDIGLLTTIGKPVGLLEVQRGLT
jgi:hypothetical protein